jgi:RNA recognition motif-containing protein
MGTKLFVGGLSWNTNDDGLRAAFEAFGTVSEAKVISDRETGRSRGFGFVTMSAPAEAQAAISKMNGAPLDGRTIRVNEAEERGEGGGARRNRW